MPFQSRLSCPVRCAQVRGGLPMTGTRTLQPLRTRSLAMLATAAMVVVALLTPPGVSRAPSAPRAALATVDAQLQRVATGTVKVIVQAADGAVASIPKAIAKAGGKVTLPLPIINGAAATVPAKSIAKLAATEGIRA